MLLYYRLCVIILYTLDLTVICQAFSLKEWKSMVHVPLMTHLQNLNNMSNLTDWELVISVDKKKNLSAI